MPNSIVHFITSKGDIKLEVFEDKTPVTAANFLDYVKSGFYDGTIFHRVIPGFVAQGGGFVPGMSQKDTKAPIVNEAAKGPANSRGTLSMARTPHPDSATSQFFINFVDNKSLDYRGPGPGAGYCVFAKVIEGMDVVDAMALVQTGRRPPHADVPKEDIVLITAKVL
ncbi:MAG: peptidylprolyl isomerase [Spirochaetales bacterium]|jgi:peptidyl-prolyl cis-trans isomerase B (cyclophilin B)